MSIFSTLDSAFGSAVQTVANDASNVVGSVLSGVQLRIKTNLGPAFIVGGLYTDNAGSSPGLLSTLGLKYNIDVLGADGKPITTIGDPPATDPIIIAAYATVLIGLSYVLYRGVRSMLRS